MPVENQQDKPPAKPLSSLWDGLSPHLIATFWEVDREGNRPKGTEDITVKAPLIDGNFSVSLSWQSPFESAGIEAKAPAIMAMVQSGALQPLVDSLSGFGVASLSDKAKEQLKSVEGRHGMTKLNSTQIFSGMPPADIQCTLLFRAWRDAIEEVRTPFDQLMFWALPQQLAGQSTLISRALDYGSGKETDIVNVLLPSKSPVMLAMNYQGVTYKPLVIESISKELITPINKDGDTVVLSVPIKFSTLTAIDKKDWSKFRG